MKLRSLSGTFMMAAFGLVALGRASETGLLFFVLLALRDFIASYFFFHRKVADTSPPNILASSLAYLSTALPLIYTGMPVVTPTSTQMLASLLVITGFTLAAWATIDLSDRLGITPALRGTPCSSGVYRFFSHPMYAGYIIAEIGIVIGNPSNIWIFLISVSLYLIRMKLEDRIIRSGVQEKAVTTRDALITHHRSR